MNKFWVFFLIISFFVSCQKKPDKIAVIYSYFPDYQWVLEENNGLMSVLNSKNYQIKNYYLDSKRKEEEIWLGTTCPRIIKKISEFNPDLIIAFDDNSLRCMEKSKSICEIPILFSGINTNPQEYQIKNKLAGIVGSVYFEESIQLLENMEISTEKLVLISDNSETSNFFRKQLPDKEFAEIILTNDFEEWKYKFRQWQNSEIDAIYVLLYHKLHDKNRQYLFPKTAIDWIRANNRVPEIGFFDFSIDDGLLAGVTISGYEQAKKVGELAVSYLEEGEFPTQLITTVPNGNPHVNLSRARELGLELKNIDKWR
ncbi:MAG: hypothetical protein SVM86_04390 [Candidatus Cloacimonadota bacterium]|nr:hypothetical protein [Candidatus Cloacimonadota bacterium]